MKVNIGSHNQVKIAAAKTAFEQVFPDQKIHIKSTQASSHVSAQPLSDRETIKGAIHRAQKSLIDADFAIGIEGGISQQNDMWFSCGWVAVISQRQIMSLASSARIQIPDQVIHLIQQGKELSQVDDILFQVSQSNLNQGNYGLMTHGLVTRELAYKQAVICALSRFTQADLF